MVSETTTVSRRSGRLLKLRPASLEPSDGSAPTILRTIDWLVNSASPGKSAKRASFVGKSARWKWWSLTDASSCEDSPPLEWSQCCSEEGDTASSSAPSLHVPMPSELDYQPLETFDAYHHVNTPELDSVRNSPAIPQPPLLRRDAAESVILANSARRRWTLSVDIADEEVSDEMFVQELERIRTADGTPFALCISGVSTSALNHYFSDDVFQGTSATMCSSPTSNSSTSSPWPWTSARLALLTVRELVRTERHYLSSLQLLSFPHENGGPLAPSLMITYAKAICCVSEALISGFEADMTVAGVCTTFARTMGGVDRTKKDAYTNWCSAVGDWFTDEPSLSGRRPSTETRRNSVGFSRARPKVSMPTSFPEAQMFTAVRRRLSSGSIVPSSKQKIPLATRDLAILPTQRVMRYVLLYRDLLAHTPLDSPIHSLVAHAVDIAIDLAQKCDNAQSNAAFFIR